MKRNVHFAPGAPVIVDRRFVCDVRGRKGCGTSFLAFCAGSVQKTGVRLPKDVKFVGLEDVSGHLHRSFIAAHCVSFSGERCVLSVPMMERC